MREVLADDRISVEISKTKMKERKEKEKEKHKSPNGTKTHFIFPSKQIVRE